MIRHFSPMHWNMIVTICKYDYLKVRRMSLNDIEVDQKIYIYKYSVVSDRESPKFGPMREKPANKDAILSREKIKGTVIYNVR